MPTDIVHITNLYHHHHHVACPCRSVAVSTISILCCIVLAWNADYNCVLILWSKSAPLWTVV